MYFVLNIYITVQRMQEPIARLFSMTQALEHGNASNPQAIILTIHLLLFTNVYYYESEHITL